MAIHDILKATPGSDSREASRATVRLLVYGKSDKALVPETPFVLEGILTDKDRRIKVDDTSTAPWRKICALECVGTNGARQGGTGWFAGPRTIITAGHCVFDPVEMAGWAKQITITPARNGEAEKPFGSVISTKFTTTERWQEDQDEDFDYAAIHLDEDLGATTGTFGIAVLSDAELKDRMLNISGYPVDQDDGKSQYFHANRVKEVDERRIYYDIDTMGGQSGSPVWAYLDDSTEPVVVGIHAYGIDQKLNANYGPRINSEAMGIIRDWIAKGKP